MTVRGTLALPLQVGPLGVRADGTINLDGRDRFTVYPFAQPQPYYVINPDTTTAESHTTDGARLLFQTVQEAPGAVRVHAGFYLMAALLISPEGLVLLDLDPDSLIYRRNEQSLTITVGADGRWGLKEGSEVVFCDDTHRNRIEFTSLMDELPAWGTSGPATESNWRH